MEKKLKKWQGWLLFGGSMVVVFVLGLMVVSSLMERRAEVVSVFNNRPDQFTDSIVSQNEKFARNYPREYQHVGDDGRHFFRERVQQLSERGCAGTATRDVHLVGGICFFMEL
jgi:hypothetical protein